MKTQNPIVLVDFDGVIHSYKSGWKGADVIPDPPVEGAIDFLLRHLPVPDALGMTPEYIGPEVQIYSARSSQKGGIKAMREWLIKNGVDEWYFRDDILKLPTTKPPAFVTLDDRCICFTGKFPTTEELKNFTSWQKKDVAGNPDFGATGEFPDGKKNSDDEGELRFGVAHDSREVIINFGKPIAWFSLPPYQARALAELIIKHADEI